MTALLDRIASVDPPVLDEDRAYHKIAVCRWCSGRFYRIYGWQWRCETDACFDRCVAHAILKENVADDTESPYFYLPLPLQVDIEESPIKRLLVWGPVGISKSFGARMSLYKRCRKIAGYQALLLRCTYDQLEKNHLKYMPAECSALGDATYKENNKRPKVKFENGSELSMGYCADESDIPQHSGPEWDEVDFEEAGHFLPKALEKIPLRDRGSAVARASMAKLGLYEGRTRLLTNPEGRGMRFLVDHYVDRAPDPADYPEYDPKFYGAITGAIADNPYLSETFRQSVLGGLNATALKQLADGRIDVMEGQFFPTFNPAVHVVSA